MGPLASNRRRSNSRPGIRPSRLGERELARIDAGCSSRSTSTGFDSERRNFRNGNHRSTERSPACLPKPDGQQSESRSIKTVDAIDELTDQTKFVLGVVEDQPGRWVTSSSSGKAAVFSMPRGDQNAEFLVQNGQFFFGQRRVNRSTNLSCT